MTPVSPVETALALSQQVEKLKAELAIARRALDYEERASGILASTVDMLNTWARECSVEQSKGIEGAHALADRLWSDQSARLHKAEEALAAAQQQAAESAALAERMREPAKKACEFIDKMHIYLPGDLSKAEAMGMCAELAEAYATEPTAALTEYRDRVLEEVAQHFDDNEEYSSSWRVAAEIRAMKGGK